MPEERKKSEAEVWAIVAKQNKKLPPKTRKRINDLLRQVRDPEGYRKKRQASHRAWGAHGRNAEKCRRYRERKKEHPHAPSKEEVSYILAGFNIGRKQENTFVVIGPDGSRHREILSKTLPPELTGSRETPKAPKTPARSS